MNHIVEKDKTSEGLEEEQKEKWTREGENWHPQPTRVDLECETRSIIFHTNTNQTHQYSIAIQSHQTPQNATTYQYRQYLKLTISFGLTEN